MSAFCAFDLKSNMDRFIDCSALMFLKMLSNLKSNMDRFIEASVLVLSPTVQHLKSNMDRFIAYGNAQGHIQDLI